MKATMFSKSKTMCNDSDSDDGGSPQVPYRRERTPSIVVQSLGLSFHKDSNIRESIELPGDEEDRSQNSNSSDEPKSSDGTLDEPQNANVCDSSGGSVRGSSSSLQNSPANLAGSMSPIRGSGRRVVGPGGKPIPNTDRRLSLNIGSTAPRRQSLTVDGLGSYSPLKAESPTAARNKAALKPGHSLMGWIKLASTAENLSGTYGKIIEVTPEMLEKHDREDDCWVALKGNVYNVTTYLQYHPGGVDELMKGAGRDATELFNEIHRWVNYESILAKCLVGPFKVDSPIKQTSPASRGMTTSTTTSNMDAKSRNNAQRKDPTVAQKPNRRQSIALTVPSPNKYQSLLLHNNSSHSSTTQIQQPPTYVIMQDKSCIKVKIQDFMQTLPHIRNRHLICDLHDSTELHLSLILSYDWLYRIHLRLDQPVIGHDDGESGIKAELSNDHGLVTLLLMKREAAIWNKIGNSMDLNDSLCEMTLADKYFRPCKLISKQKLTHDTYLFGFKLQNTLMYVPIGWHVLIREHIGHKSVKDAQYDYQVHKNYTVVMPTLDQTSLGDKSNGATDESGFMQKLYFIIKIYQNGVLTSKLDQLSIGDSVDISDYQSIDFDIEDLVNVQRSIKNWILLAAGTGITPFCRIILYLLSQDEESVKSVSLVFFNKTQNDIIWRDQFDNLAKKHKSRFTVKHVLSEEPVSKDAKSAWTGRRGRISREILAEQVDVCNPDELKILACGPRAFTQSTKALVAEQNLMEKLYIFHG